MGCIGEHGNEYFGHIKDEEFQYSLSDYQLLKETPLHVGERPSRLPYFL
jgi:hypothetical protein